MITAADKDGDTLLKGSLPSNSLAACSLIQNKQSSHSRCFSFPQSLFISGGWVWWQEERGRPGTLRHNKGALKGKGIIRFIASNKS